MLESANQFVGGLSLPQTAYSLNLEMTAAVVIGVVIVVVWFLFPPLRWVVDACKLPLFIWFVIAQYNRPTGLTEPFTYLTSLLPKQV